MKPIKFEMRQRMDLKITYHTEPAGFSPVLKYFQSQVHETTRFKIGDELMNDSTLDQVWDHIRSEFGEYDFGDIY